MRSLKLKQSPPSSVLPPVVSSPVSGGDDLATGQQMAATNATNHFSSADTEKLKPATKSTASTSNETDGVNHESINSKSASGPNLGQTDNRDNGQAFAEHTLDGGRSPVQPASLESASSSFLSSSSSSSSSPSSSSALSSSSSTNTPATNGSGGSSSGSSTSNMTAFLSKLWRMVNDNHNDDQIRWSQSGCSFVIMNQIQFAKDMLPIYFKHSNMASFIRQLNMYGFRKIPLIGANGSGDQRVDVAQFYHVNFMRGQEQRLASIKRKNNSSRTHNLVVNGSFCDEVRAILSDVKSIRDGQNSSESILGALQLDNKSLWRDVAILRSQHHKQRRVIEKLMQFLLSLIQNRGNMVKRRRMKFGVSQDDFRRDSSGTDSGQDNSDVLFSMTANEADDGLLQMGEFRGHSSNGGGGSLDNQNLNHNHHHHYYNVIEGGPSRPMELGDVESLGTAAAFAGKRGQLDTLAIQRGPHLAHEDQTLAGTGSRRTSSISMASGSTVAAAATAPTTTSIKQLFELAPSSSSNSVAVPSSPSVFMFGAHSASRNGKSGGGNSNPSLPLTRPIAPLNSSSAARAAEDELVPNGATAASMTASIVARKPSLSIGSASTGNQQFHSARASSTPPKSNHSRQQQAAAAAAAFKLNQLGQENIVKTSDSSSISIANQHHNHLQMQQPQQQHLAGVTNQLLQQSTTATGQQQSGQQQPNLSSSICYPISSPAQFQTNGRSCDEGSSRQHFFNNSHQQQVGIGFANNGQHQQQSGGLIDNQRRQQLAQQQQMAQFGARSVGANPINGLLNNCPPNHHHNQQQQQQLQLHHHSSRLGNCQHQMSQWTSNSIYNTMVQQDLAAMGPATVGASNGLVAGGFSNMNGVFNELRSRPDFLSALEQHHNQQMGGAQQQVAASSNSNESNDGANSISSGQSILGVSMNQTNGGRHSTASSGSGPVYYR